MDYMFNLTLYLDYSHFLHNPYMHIGSRYNEKNNIL
jgi:hypothetical protein